MTAAQARTIADKVLLAAYDLDDGAGRHFTAEDLVVAAWRRFPLVFGLRGHSGADGKPKYPDSNRVFAEVMGSKPLLARGYLTKVGTKVYSLTPSGRARASGMLAFTGTTEPGSRGGKAMIPREILGKLQRLLRSRATLRTREDEMDRITFHDACVFWGITAMSNGIELQGAIADLETAIRTAESALEAGASELRTGERDLTESTTDLLWRTHRFMQDRFEQELNTIYNRKDQR